MTLPRPLARARAAAFASALGAGVLLLVPAPAPAQAGVLDGGTVSSAIQFSGAGCAESGPGNSSPPDVALTASGAPVTSSASSSKRYSAGDPGDFSDLAASMSTVVTAIPSGNALGTLRVDTAFFHAASASRGAATGCPATGYTQGSVSFTFDLPTAKILSLQVDGSLSASYSATFAGATGGIVSLISQRKSSTTRATAFLPAGTWSANINLTTTLSTPTAPGDPSSLSETVRLVADLADAGSGVAPATGKASRYVDLAAARSCADGTLAVTWKKKAGKGDRRAVRKAVFKVDGTKVKTARKPKRGSTTVLSGLPVGRPVDVEVVLQLARKGAGRATVERSYLQCG